MALEDSNPAHKNQYMRVLITGGAGFIGSHLAKALVADDHVVTVLDSLSVQVHGDRPEASALYRSLPERVRFIRGSVLDELSWERALEDQDAIVHLAAETGTGQSMYEIKRYTDVNVAGTALMLSLLARKKGAVRKILIASSRALYGEGKYGSANGVVYPPPRSRDDLQAGRFDLFSNDDGTPLRPLPTDENSAIHPASVYGITKHCQEQLVMTMCPALGIDSTALRLQNVYGPGQSMRNPYTGILSIFSSRLLNHQPLRVFEDGKESRDFVYIDDVVDGTLKALYSSAANGEVFGIGSGVPTSILAAAHAMRSAFSQDVEILVTGEYRLGDIRHNFADLSKAERILGYRPSVDFAAGILRFADWASRQPRQPDGYDRSILELRGLGLLGQAPRH